MSVPGPCRPLSHTQWIFSQQHQEWFSSTCNRRHSPLALELPSIIWEEFPAFADGQSSGRSPSARLE